MIPTPDPTPTVRRGSLWEQPQDTHQTERELNGWRETQGTLFERPDPAPRRDPRQVSLL